MEQLLRAIFALEEQARVIEATAEQRGREMIETAKVERAAMERRVAEEAV